MKLPLPLVLGSLVLVGLVLARQAFLGPMLPPEPAPKLKATLKGHTHNVRGVAFSPDGKTLASYSFLDTIRLWYLATGKEKLALKCGRDSVESMSFSPDGKTLASGGWDNLVRFWDVATGTEKAPCKGHTGWVTSVAYSPDGKTLVSGSDDKTIRLWEIPAAKKPGK
jgi:WD40 repeat protein